MRTVALTSRAACAFFLLTPALAKADVNYIVETTPDPSKVKVTMKFDAKAGPLELQMPNWAPGAYILSTPGLRVEGFKLSDGQGQALPIQRTEPNSWKTTLPQSGKLTAEYVAPAQFDAGALHYSGPSTYLYIVGRKTERCRLDLKLPEGWKVAVGLDAIGNSKTAYKAPNYDVLADNPVTLGDFIELTYTSHGKPHTIAMRGAQRAKVDQAKVLKMCQTISDTEGDFFGGLPFNKYVWHFSVFPAVDGGGGLEHLTSTQISLPTGVGPLCARVCEHEYFHLWNVKRIRSRVLGPFDYTKLPKTGALYWLEGVTDYYASLLIARSGYLGEKEFMDDLVSNLTNVRRNPARLEVSPFESSLRVDEENGGRGNSGGYRISYYTLGWLVGFCLDVDLRTRTGGKATLDDVERALWEKCKNDRPGFEEDEIERIYVGFGGSRDYFRKVVKGAGELPVEEALDRIGYRLEVRVTPQINRGFTLSRGPGGNSVLSAVGTVESFAESAGLKVGDQIAEINGVSVRGETGQDSRGKTLQELSSLKIGDLATLKVRRGDQELTVSFRMGEVQVPSFSVRDTGTINPAKRALRKALLSKTGR